MNFHLTGPKVRRLVWDCAKPVCISRDGIHLRCSSSGRLDGHNQLPKVSLSVKFTDGIEIVRSQAQAVPPDPFRHQNLALALPETRDCSKRA
jgi:hypothetical protein